MASTKLDQSLGDIISSDSTVNPTRSGRRRGRGGRSSRGPKAADGQQTEQSDNGDSSNGVSNPLSRKADSSNPSSASSSGPVRRNRTVNRKSPYPTSGPSSASASASHNQPAAARWQHDRYISTNIDLPTSLPLPHTATTINRVVGDTIHITNLHSDVKPDDLYDIFAPLGHIRQHTVHFDERGRSLGTATITFTRADVADAAVAEFDGAEVDGKAMSVKLVGQVVQQRLGGGGGVGGGGGSYVDSILNPAAAAMQMLPAMLQMMAVGLPTHTRGNTQQQQQQQQRQQAGGKGRDKASQRGDKKKGADKDQGREHSKADGAAAAGKSGAGGKGGRGKQERAPVTADALDAEMESYHTQRNATSSTAAADSTGGNSEGTQPADNAAVAISDVAAE